MPSTYAHYRMGQEVYKSLPALARTTINNHKELYDIGLHGPDILFYYQPLAVCAVNKQGYDMHEKSGLEFFKKAGKLFVRQMMMIRRHCLRIYMGIAVTLRLMSAVMDI